MRPRAVACSTNFISNALLSLAICSSCNAYDHYSIKSKCDVRVWHVPRLNRTFIRDRYWRSTGQLYDGKWRSSIWWWYIWVLHTYRMTKHRVSHIISLIWHVIDAPFLWTDYDHIITWSITLHTYGVDYVPSTPPWRLIHSNTNPTI